MDSSYSEREINQGIDREDLETIIQTEHIQQLKRHNTIRLSIAPPLLVVEVVSPGELQRDRDYVAKRMQYQARGVPEYCVPEYWVIDPQLETVLVLELINSVYTEVATLTGSETIASPQLGELTSLLHNSSIQANRPRICLER